MNVDKSVAALLYAVVVCVTISRSTDKENRMDDDDEVKQHSGPTVSARSPLLRHRQRSTSADHFTATEPPDHARRQHYRVAFLDLSYVSTALITSLWIVLSSVSKLGQLISGYILMSDR